MSRETNVRAYRQIQAEGLLSRLRWLVYDHLFHYGPCTAKEVHTHLRRHGSNDGCFTTRLSELRRLGVVRERGLVTCRYTNRKVILWDVTTDLPTPITKTKTNKQIIKELQEENDRLMRLLSVCKCGNQMELMQ